MFLLFAFPNIFIKIFFCRCSNLCCFCVLLPSNAFSFCLLCLLRRFSEWGKIFLAWPFLIIKNRIWIRWRTKKVPLCRCYILKAYHYAFVWMFSALQVWKNDLFCLAGCKYSYLFQICNRVLKKSFKNMCYQQLILAHITTKTFTTLDYIGFEF